jgi:hypothetical protein
MRAQEIVQEDFITPYRHPLAFIARRRFGFRELAYRVVKTSFIPQPQD